MIAKNVAKWLLLILKQLELIIIAKFCNQILMIAIFVLHVLAGFAIFPELLGDEMSWDLKILVAPFLPKGLGISDTYR